ncbi:HAD-IIA family hydrolase [Pikeienuella piscinae]|uniref:HAD-IIA family hydrolase n=1 Tax=Pikeienuella piscinae TaxID=2748098 RepID=A0A7L5C087_9RHOB|nr:HAD-IIA family hydrolase [Pikeienuella piscinae]QIE56783.1 HAD-IIA family hydrolase [Pikeienuella piscinae]
MDEPNEAAWAFAAYEGVRGRLPAASAVRTPTAHRSLSALIDLYDVFLLDAFGVLNIGETPIAGAPERVLELRAAGKRVMVVTNAASYPKRVLLERYRRLGFEFPAEDVVSSRETLLAALKREPERQWGIMTPAAYGREELEHLDIAFLGDDPVVYDRVDGFILMGSGEWTEARQALLEASLQASPRPVFVGNPDIVAPREGGMTREPGYFAHRVADAAGVDPHFFGKPFPAIYEIVLSRVGAMPRERIAMVGDTLHTDILGGAGMGFGTVLVTDHGALKGEDIEAACARAGIYPTHTVRDT